MTEDLPRLPDEHLGKDREIAVAKRTKQRCKTCYDRGYVGTNQKNMLVPCSKCVDVDAVADAVAEAVERGEIAESSIDESALRLIELRRALSGRTGPFITCDSDCRELVS